MNNDPTEPGRQMTNDGNKKYKKVVEAAGW